MNRYLISLLLLSALYACSQSAERPDGASGDQPAAEPTAVELPGLSHCTDPRPEICTQNYAPVCGVHADGSRQTYSNGCMACSNPEVVGSLAGACPE